MINRLALGMVALACIAAAGGGAYVAARHNSQQVAVAPAAQPAAPVTPSVVAPSGTVAETEAIIDDGPKGPAPEIRSAPRTDAARPTPRVSKPERSRPAGRRMDTPVAAATAPDTSEPPTASAENYPVESRPAPVQDAEPASNSAASEPVVSEQADHSSVAPPKIFEELVVPADAVLGLQIDKALSSERARVEDAVDARVTRDVRVGDRVAIPSGAKVLGSVTLVERGGKIKERARLGIRFHTLVLADGTRMPINTETVYREGSSPAGESAAKIGGAAIGGAILGGGRGAVIGGTAGAAGGTAAVMAGGRNAATVQAGSTMTVRILDPVTVTVEKEEHDQ